MIQVFYFEVKSAEAGKALAEHFKTHEALHFVTADPVHGTLDECKEILEESNAFPSQLYKY